MVTETATAWYQEGNWPLIGAILTLLVSNAVSLYFIFLQARKQFQYTVKLNQISHYNQQLAEFYNPLITYLKINGAIFEKLGPRSYPDDERKRTIAAKQWKTFRNNILANNINISNILLEKSHLIDHSNSLEKYLPLQLHLQTYAEFVKVATDRYRNFQFPRDIVEHVEIIRKNIQSRIIKEQGE